MRKTVLACFGISAIAILGCGGITNKKGSPQTSLRPFSLEEDSVAKGRLDAIEARLSKVEERVSAIERALGDLRDFNVAQGKQIASLEGLFDRMAKIELLGADLKANSATKDALQTSVADVLNQLTALKMATDSLAVSRETIVAKVSAVEIWKAETETFLENLKHADITAAVADLQTWKSAVATPMADLLAWKAKAEERLGALETLGESTKSCMKALDPKLPTTEASPEGAAAPCGALRKEVQALAGLYVQIDGFSRELNSIADRVAGVESSDAERVKTLQELQNSLIRTRFVTLRGLRPCGLRAGVFVRLSAREAYTDEFVFSGVRRLNGALSDGEYSVREGAQTLCTFRVASPYRPLSAVEQVALGTESDSLRIKRVSWKNEDGTTIQYDVLSSAMGDVQ